MLCHETAMDILVDMLANYVLRKFIFNCNKCDCFLLIGNLCYRNDTEVMHLNVILYQYIYSFVFPEALEGSGVQNT